MPHNNLSIMSHYKVCFRSWWRMGPTLKISQWQQNCVKIWLNLCSLTPLLKVNYVATDCQKDKKRNCNRELKPEQNFRAESSRKFNKILQKTVADFEKSQNYKIELEKWKRIIVFGKGEREQEPRATFPNEPSQIERSWLCSRLAWRRSSMESLYTLLLLFPNEVSLSPGEFPIMLAMTEWKM